MIIHPAIIWCMKAGGSIKIRKKLKEMRRKRGITQEKLAELAGTSYKYVQRIEGNKPPDIRLSTLFRIAKALNIKPTELLP